MSVKQSKKLTGFLGVFEQKLDKMIARIKKEYEKPKSERNREGLKKLVKEAKEIRKLVREMQNETSESCRCPACGHSFKLKNKNLI